MAYWSESIRLAKAKQREIHQQNAQEILASGEKGCSKCCIIKPLSAFAADPRKILGLRSHCRECEAARHAGYLQRTRKWRQDTPERNRARNLAQAAVRRGRLKRLACQRCGAPKADAHHHDYSKPLDVIFLCRTCHHAEHRSLRASREG